MKTFAMTLCIIGTALTLAACESSSSYNSGANYASGETAGQAQQATEARAERVFRKVQSK